MTIKALLLRVTVFGVVLLGAAFSRPDESLVAERVEEVFKQALRTELVQLDEGPVELSFPPSEVVLKELRSYGDSAVRFIARHLESQVPNERRLAVHLLMNQGSVQSAPYIGKALRDSAAEVRLMAVYAAAATPTAELRHLLALSAKEDVDLRVRSAAQSELKRLDN